MPEVIEISLSRESISNARSQLEAYRNGIAAKAAAGRAGIAESGAEHARSYLSSALPVAMRGSWTTGSLASSISAEDQGSSSVVSAKGRNAAFVEFGTGVRGSSSPYPGDKGWAYDVNGHGSEGWYFPDGSKDSGWTWTTGIPSVPYMWTSAAYMRMHAAEHMRRAFS